MSSLTERTIAALRSNHDQLAVLIPEFTSDQLTLTSGAAEWSVADVLSHLGSGAEITLANLQAGLAGSEPPADGFNQSVWDRWNALAPADQASAFLDSDEALVAAFEGLTQEQRAETLVKTFLPSPVPISTYAGLRLSEAAQHSWDVRVAFDPDAALAVDAADLLAEYLAGDLSFLLGFLGKPQHVHGPVVLEISGAPYALSIGDAVALGTTAQAGAPTATFDGPVEAVIRLIGGRLSPEHTPAAVSVTGNVTLDQLRLVFPGF